MCGIFGIIGDEPVADALYHGLIQLQHRGQDACGVFVYHPQSHSQSLQREHGLVTQVFTPANMPLPEAPWGIGHVRYPTAGSTALEDTQPMYLLTENHSVAMAQNGNVVNYHTLAARFLGEGRPLATSCDIEAILRIFSDALINRDITFSSVCAAVKKVYEQVEGAYSVVGMITGKGLFAFRDPRGIKPLLHGIRPEGKQHAFASETEALSFLGFLDIHSVNPGELVWIDNARRVRRRRLARADHAHCSFEWVYFSRPTSTLDEREVYHSRSRLGELLAEKIRKARLSIDVIVGVPDSARAAAIAVANNLRVRYEEGLFRKEHVGRTFIMPSQAVRERALSRKLAAVPSVFKGKRVLLVDDSIVRGTVSRKVVRLARRAGAKRVYFASSFPPIRFPCHYGIDFPDRQQLLGADASLKEICAKIDADRLFYNDEAALKEAVGLDDLCLACVNGRYPVGDDNFEQLRALRQDQIDSA